MELWIVRHGETVDNFNHVLQGQQPGKLSELGIAQARQTGVELAKQKFSEVFCSDLGRTKETLKHILESFPDADSLKVDYCPLIREKSFGVLEGLKREVYNDKVKNSGLSLRDFKPEGGESWHEVHQRAVEFLDLLNHRFIWPEKSESKDLDPSMGFQNLHVIEPTKKVQGSAAGLLNSDSDKSQEELPKVLVVSHRGYITELLNVINFSISKENFVTLADLGNCSIHVLKVTSGGEADKNRENVKYQFIKKNDVSHIKNE